METRYLENQVAYLNSKTDEHEIVTGDFRVTDKKLNKRTKIISIETDKVYWVKSLNIGVPVIKKQDQHIYHRVQRGDTIQTIANKYGVQASELAKNVSSLAVGMEIIVK